MEWLKIVSKPALKYGIVAGSMGISAILMYQYLNKKQDEEIVPEMRIRAKVPEIVIDYETEDLLKFPESEIDSDRISNKEPVEVDALFDDFPEQQKPTRKVLLLGLENSGKSSLLSQLSREASGGEYQPTKGFNVVCISFDDIDLSIWEIGGGLEYRSYWKNFCTSTNMIFFVVDSCDREKFPEAKKFFYTVFHDLPEEIELHVAATKADLIDSASVEEIQESLGLEGSKVEIFKVAVQAGGANDNVNVDKMQEFCLYH